MTPRNPNWPAVDLRPSAYPPRHTGPHWLSSVARGLGMLVILVLAFATTPPVRRPASRPVVPPAAHPGAAPAPAAVHGDERFLIVGLTQDLHRTDSIMVAQWDAAHHQARVLGVPRDIGVTIQGIGYTKLVHAYATGGVGRTRAAVARLLNVPVAHYFVFSLPALRHLVDLIGGVPITVEKRMVYNDHEQGLFINLQAGPQVLDGARAEQYLRFRNDPDGDIGRIRRQQHFLRAALQAVHRPQVWVRLPQLISTARAELGTDLTSEQLLGWVHEIDHLGPDAVSAQSIDGHAATLFDSMMRMELSFWVPDPEDLRAKVRWLVTGAAPPLPKP
jgi:polyisoprenyl-teichoic acid--peptidoglycan teichoic acid transferase